MTLKKLARGLKYARIASTAAAIGAIHRNAAKKYLARSLGNLPGLPAKAAQLFQMRLGHESDLQSHPNPLPSEQIKHLIDTRSPNLANAIEEIDPNPSVASLGQVHRAWLRSGQEVAIKVQFPGVADELSQQVDLLLSASNMGPPRRFGFDVEGYREYLTQHFQRETDYQNEARVQLNFREVWRNWAIIPNVLTEYSTKDILVQTFEESIPLSQLGQMDLEHRACCAFALTQFMLASIFQQGWVHADLQPANWGYRVDQKKIVLYDFGASLYVDENFRFALRRTIENLRENKQPDYFSLFVSLGFDPIKLGNAGPGFDPLCQRFFEPLITTTFWEPAEWQLGEHTERLLKEEKWWFRMAGPPWFLIFMRSVFAVIHALIKLRVPIPMGKIYDSIHSVALPIPSHFQIPTVKRPQQHKRPDPKAKELHVLVSESGKEIVSVTLPARAVDNLTELLDPEMEKKIQAQGHDLEKIRKQVQQSGYIPQTLFEASAGQRQYKVWLS